MDVFITAAQIWWVKKRLQSEGKKEKGEARVFKKLELGKDELK